MLFFRQALSLSLATTVLVASPLALNMPAIAKAGPSPSQPSAAKDLANWPTRPFLPPVATINPKIEASTTTDSPTISLDKDNTDDLEVVSLAAVNTPVLTTKPAIERLDTPLDVLTDNAKALKERQHELEKADLNTLWEATVERSPVIRFSLEKLATPDDLAQEQSSLFMRKTLGVLISGATLASTMLPGAGGFGGYRNMGVMAGGDALRNLTHGKQALNAQRLTATEKIQLAGMIDDLQREVIQAYHDYRRSLSALTLAHQQTTTASELYSQQMTLVSQLPPNSQTSTQGQTLAAMQSAMLMAQGATFHQARLQEMQLKQDAKQHRLQLERLAGVDAVADLQLAIDPNQSLAAAPAEANPNPTADSTSIVSSGDSPTTATDVGPSQPSRTEAALDEGVQWQHRVLFQELRDDDESALADVGMLWQTAIERSGTIRFAIEKLSRKNAVGDDPNDTSFAEQMVKQVARLGGVAGSMWTGTPAGLIGGNMVEELVQDPEKRAAAAQMRVTDADMVLLAKEVEALQGELIQAYYTYRHANERLTTAHKAQEELARYEAFIPADAQTALLPGEGAHQPSPTTTNPAALVAPLMASVVTQVNELSRQAQQGAISAREALILLVGSDAVTALDQLQMNSVLALPNDEAV